MNIKTIIAVFLAGFVVFCGYLVVESGVFDNSNGCGFVAVYQAG